MSADEMNKAAEQATRTYTIASRCGVFAKSDVQPLINQGAKTEDIAASIYKAVVNQTIAGLAQGRPIQGNILYLGGPLTFSTVLRKSFDEALGVTGTCPGNSLLYVALGAAAGGVQRPVRPGAYRHRLRLHHRQAGGRGRAEPDPLYQLSAEPRQPAAPYPAAAAENL